MDNYRYTCTVCKGSSVDAATYARHGFILTPHACPHDAYCPGASFHHWIEEVDV